MTLYMLDTNAASEAMRGHPAVDQRLRSLTIDQWCISAVTCAEIHYGAARRPEATRLHRLIGAFLRIAPVLPWDAHSARRHGTLRAHLKAQGRPIGDFDEMIAAHALALGAVVVTDNTLRFARVPGLAMENWLRPER
jgi:tRNA(fMet)-specific endonuclease VapC